MLGYLLLVAVSLGGFSLMDATWERRILLALAGGAVAWLGILVLLVTPARMWYEAKRRIAELTEQLERQPSSAGPIGFTAGKGANVTLINSRIVQSAGARQPTLEGERAPQPWLSEIKIAHRSFRIVDVPRDGLFIRGRTFQDCTIYGPSILYPMGTSFEHCRFDGELDSVFWEIAPSQKSGIGVIGVEDCHFIRCTFVGVGLAGDRLLYEQFKLPSSPADAELTPTPSPESAPDTASPQHQSEP